MLHGSPVVSVRVLREGPFSSLEHLKKLITMTSFKSGLWHENLIAQAAVAGVDEETAQRQTDMSDMMEGLYIKVEDADRVTQRLKFVRPGFKQAIVESGSHWLDRPIIQNMLAPGVDIFR